MKAVLQKALLVFVGPYECEAAPDGGVRGWLVVFSSFMIFSLSVGYQYTTGIFFKSWVKSIEFAAIAPATLAWANSIDSAGFLGGSIFAGWIIVRTSPRVCAVAGAVLTATGAVIAATLSTSTPIGLLYLYLGFGVFMGVGSAFSLIASVCAVQQYFTSRRGTATGITVAGSGVGAFILGPLLESLNESVGWRVALAGYGIAAGLLCSACAAAVIPISFVPAQKTTERIIVIDTDMVSGIMQHNSSAEVDTREVVPNPPSKLAIDEFSPTRDLCFTQTQVASNSDHAQIAPTTPRSTCLKSAPSYSDLINSPGYTTFCCALIANCLMWFMVPTVSEEVGMTCVVCT